MIEPMPFRPISRLTFALLAAFLMMAGAIMAQEATGWTASAGMMPIGADPERPDAC